MTCARRRMRMGQLRGTVWLPICGVRSASTDRRLTPIVAGPPPVLLLHVVTAGFLGKPLQGRMIGYEGGEVIPPIGSIFRLYFTKAAQAVTVLLGTAASPPAILWGRTSHTLEGRRERRRYCGWYFLYAGRSLNRSLRGPESP